MANNIRDLRTSMALTQKELCKRINASPYGLGFKLDEPTLSRLESDVFRPKGGSALENALCNALQAQPVELYGTWEELDIPLGKARRPKNMTRKEDAPFNIQELIYVLGIGKQNAKRKSRLMMELDITNERTFRALVAKAYDYGWFVANDQDGEVYYLIADVQEGIRYYKQERARAMSTMNKKLAPLARWIAQNGGAE